MTSIEEIARIATGGAPLRVWSLIVTIFGDLAPDEADWLPGSVLGQLTEPMGVRPEALRVALHRLRKDGWIESRREGRTSAHRLSPIARAETKAAAPRIYASAPARDLWLVLPEPGTDLPHGPVWITPAVGLSGTVVAAYCQRIEPDSLAPWMQSRTVQPQLIDDCDRAVEGLTAICALVRDRPPHDPVTSACLRVLAVHIWRRIALKSPDLPRQAFPDDWRGEEARTAFADVMSYLPRIPGSRLAESAVASA